MADPCSVSHLLRKSAWGGHISFIAPAFLGVWSYEQQ